MMELIPHPNYGPALKASPVVSLGGSAVLIDPPTLWGQSSLAVYSSTHIHHPTFPYLEPLVMSLGFSFQALLHKRSS